MFRTYVNEIRLERSLHFLRDLRYNVTDVACLCGFTDVQYFIRCFRERFGFTPGEYRKRSEG
jgi:AraC-like DNA-binding protein